MLYTLRNPNKEYFMQTFICISDAYHFSVMALPHHAMVGTKPQPIPACWNVFLVACLFFDLELAVMALRSTGQLFLANNHSHSPPFLPKLP